jgi:hypothetical protein
MGRRCGDGRRERRPVKLERDGVEDENQDDEDDDGTATTDDI